jgi:hypothetical protein
MDRMLDQNRPSLKPVRDFLVEGMNYPDSHSHAC